jgi:hypothetical protein
MPPQKSHYSNNKKQHRNKNKNNTNSNKKLVLVHKNGHCRLVHKIFEEFFVGILSRVRAWRKRSSISILESNLSRLREDHHKMKLLLENKIKELENNSRLVGSSSNNNVGRNTPTCSLSTTNNSIFLPSADPTLVEKYKKMLLVGIPEGAIRQKVIQDGLDPDLIFVQSPTTTTGIPLVSIVQRVQQGVKSININKKPVTISSSSSSRPFITVADISRIRSSLKATSSSSNNTPATTNKSSNENNFTSPMISATNKLPAITKRFNSNHKNNSATKNGGLRDVTNNNIPSITVAATPAEYLRSALNQKFAFVKSTPNSNNKTSNSFLDEFLG